MIPERKEATRTVIMHSIFNQALLFETTFENTSIEENIEIALNKLQDLLLLHCFQR